MGPIVKQKRMKRDQRRVQLIQTSAELFARDGFESTTTKGIADAAGITEAVIYQHFKTKDELYDAAVEFYIEKVEELLRESSALEQPDLSSMLKTLCVGWMYFAEDNANFTRMMLYSGLQGHQFSCRFFNAISLPIMNAVRERIEKGQREGWVRENVMPMASTKAIMGAMVSFNLARVIHRVDVFCEMKIEEYVENAIDIFIRGISVDPDNPDN